MHFTECKYFNGDLVEYSKSCPVVKVMAEEKMTEGSVRKAMHANWQMAVVEIVSLQKDGMFYNEILKQSGLTARTLSAVLKALGSEGLVNRTVGTTSPVRVRYSLTEAGKKLIAAGCPLIGIVAARR